MSVEPNDSIDLDACAPEESKRISDDLHATHAAVHLERLRLIKASDDAQDWKAHGVDSMAEWLVDRYRLLPSTARTWVEWAHRMDGMDPTPAETSLALAAAYDISQCSDPVPPPSSSAPVATRAAVVQRQVRSTAVAEHVKQLHDYTCQVCALRLTLPGGTAYAEGAHIRALGNPHLGPDASANVLCLCPTCHVRFDRGAITLDSGLNVVDMVTRTGLGPLRVHAAHPIDMAHVEYHRSHWVQRT